MDLTSLRTEINAIDDEMVKLFLRRMALMDDVAETKRQAHAPVLDPAREREILSRVAAEVGPELENGARLFFATLFDISRSRQRAALASGGGLADEVAAALAATPDRFPTRAMVACQGAEGAYSQQAACHLFPFPSILYFNTFDDVFAAVEKGMCPYGMLPIENSAAGSVAAIYDLMVQHHFHIARAIRQRIDHVLLAPRGVKLADVREVVSHPHALSQCNGFLKQHAGWVLTPMANTAGAARALADSGRRDLAAIASRACAELYGLDILADDIADVASNYTRFICISKKLEVYPDASKISFMLSLPHRPGALYEVMSRFAAINVNLTKLESRPIPGMDFEFRFTFELEGSPTDARVVQLLGELAADPAIEHFTFLGAYAES
ncbi:MAG: chorismate mutase [Kiritimatiellae bacterium]|nr:chorismate mutase [Kiritimatiellia bacterium]